MEEIKKCALWGELIKLITCPNCQELNGKNSTNCFNCQERLNSKSGSRKICTECRSIANHSFSNCMDCGGRLADISRASQYMQRQSSSTSSETVGEFWMYVLAIIFPVLGIILGLVYIARSDDDLGKSLILTAIFSSVVVSLILMISVL